MPLVSLLLRDDPRLQACLVADAAHVVPGAAGRHVGLIQKVLLVLDKAPISAGELRSSLYGPTTTAAVLAYKRKRNIVNRSYQTTADNIVGKMTIAQMDHELLVLDLRSMSGRVVCTNGGQAPPPRPAIVAAGQAGLVGGPTPLKPKKQRPAKLRIIVQKTNRAAEFGDRGVRCHGCPLSASLRPAVARSAATASRIASPWSASKRRHRHACG